MTDKRCPLWGQEIFPFKASLKLPDWEIPEIKQFQGSSNSCGCKMWGKKEGSHLVLLGLLVEIKIKSLKNW